MEEDGTNEIDLGSNIIPQLASQQCSTSASQYHNNVKTQGSRPASSIISMAKRRAQARVSIAEKPYVSVILLPLLGQVLPT